MAKELASGRRRGWDSLQEPSHTPRRRSRHTVTVGRNVQNADGTPRAEGRGHDPTPATVTSRRTLSSPGGSVISVAVLRGGAAAGYYLQAQGCEHALVQDLTGSRAVEQSVMPGVDLGYYVNGRELPGRWVGGGSHALGLDGGFTRTDARVLEQLLEGRNEGNVLVAPVWRRDDTGARVDVRRAGFDVTFSAPKSVSTLMALADPETVGQVMAAHEQAVTEALGLLERLAARVARGHHGDGQRAPRIATSGLVGAAFTHTTSRALDPQLHTHVVLANLAQGSDGRWSALDSRTLHREATTASYLYQHLLRAELTRRLGVGWTGIDRGVAEVEGVPLPVRREFSTRRRQIETALAERAGSQLGPGLRGRARQLAARAACLATRPGKRHTPPAELRQNWAERATAAGFSPDDLAELLTRRAAAPPTVELASLDRRVLGADGVTREQSTFNQGALLRELISHLPPGAAVSTDQLLDTTAALVRTDEVVPVLTGDGRAYTTRDLLITEAQTLALASRTDRILAQLDKKTVAAAAVRANALRPEQQRVVFSLLTSGRPVEVLAGPAGCGKTAGLALATRTWADAGITVTGTAVAALTAQGLQEASGAPSVSLARALSQPDRHLPAGGVLLVDEAGMIGTRQLHQLLTTASGRDCKVVLVGDPEQLPELEAGGMFARLTQEPSALRLEGHHRQQQPWERDALQDLRSGDITSALDTYREHGRLHTHHDRDSLHTQAVTAYLHARNEQTDPWQIVLLASSRDDVRQLNHHVRQALLQRGQLGKKALHVDTDRGPVDYRVGDQVLITRNDHPRRLLNGTTATVTGLDRDGLALHTATGAHVTVDRDWLAAGQLDHGYAMTLHKAQGRTVHTALVVGNESLSAQAGYVGLSRGTHANHLFLSSRDLHDLSTDCGSRVRHRPTEPARETGALTRDTRRRLAIDHRIAGPTRASRDEGRAS
jgi:conjugative relaxase-like TrwC/TraI family protein